LDGINGSDIKGDGTNIALQAGDAGIVIMDLGSTTPSVYIYRVYASSASESDPDVITPDTNPGTLRWHLVNVYGKSFIGIKLTGIAGTETLWSDYLLEEFGVAWKGPHATSARGATLYLQLPNPDPAINQFMLFPAPTTGTSTAVWTTYGTFGSATGPVGGSAIFYGATSGTITLTPTATAGTTVLTLPATTGTLAKLENKITDLAAITSAELYGKVSDETGSGSGSPLLVFNQGPTLVAPALGAATATSLYATGVVDGLAPIVITATSAGYTISSTTSKSGYFFTNPVAAAAAFYFTLPTAAAGLQYCVGNGAAKTGVVRVTATGSGIIDLDGTNGSANGWATASAVAGNFGCFIGMDNTHWKAIPTKGTWTIAGP
jgi:hypothetical protein